MPSPPLAGMDVEMKTGFGFSRSGSFVQAAALLLLLGGSPLWGAQEGPPGPPPGRWAILFILAPLALALAALGIYRWASRRRQRALKLRDEQLFQLIDQWTKSLQQEVAERKEAQRALQASQQYIMRQERLAAVGQLAAGLAHEFNNILTIIQGHASLLMDNPHLDDEAVESLTIINDGVERTARLIKQMLAFSRKQVMQQKPIDLKHALGDTEEMLARLVGERVVLRLVIAAGLPPILADPEMFQQIVINLAVNARDAMPDGGQLTIRAEPAQFAAADIPAGSDRRPGRFVHLSVTDTGSGMDTAVINRLFEPFFTTKEVGKGAGLGLASVSGMVNQHQGWIEVQSKVGQGATFNIFFPVTDQLPQPGAAPSTERPVRGGRETILSRSCSKWSAKSSKATATKLSKPPTVSKPCISGTRTAAALICSSPTSPCPMACPAGNLPPNCTRTTPVFRSSSAADSARNSCKPAKHPDRASLSSPNPTVQPNSPKPCATPSTPRGRCNQRWPLAATLCNLPP